MSERERFEEQLRMVEPHAAIIVWSDDHTPIVRFDPGWGSPVDYSSEWAFWQSRAALDTTPDAAGVREACAAQVEGLQHFSGSHNDDVAYRKAAAAIRAGGRDI